MRRLLVAFLLGLVFFVLLWVLGEPLQYNFGDAGLIAAFIVVGACLFFTQFRLSRGHPDAYRKDWPIMLALSAPFLVLVAVVLLEWEKRGAIFWSQGMGILVFCCGGTFAGAVAASLSARRGARQS